MTEQHATWLAVATIIDPSNGYTWVEASNTKLTRDDFIEAFRSEAENNARLTEAADLVDWPMVMRMLKAASVAWYR